MHVSNDQQHPIIFDSTRELQRKLYLAAKEAGIEDSMRSMIESTASIYCGEHGRK